MRYVFCLSVTGRRAPSRSPAAEQGTVGLSNFRRFNGTNPFYTDYDKELRRVVLKYLHLARPRDARWGRHRGRLDLSAFHVTRMIG